MNLLVNLLVNFLEILLGSFGIGKSTFVMHLLRCDVPVMVHLLATNCGGPQFCKAFARDFLEIYVLEFVGDVAGQFWK